MNRQKYATLLRNTRKIHRTTGVVLMVFFLVIAITGLLLGWKKNITAIQAPTERGQATDPSAWLPMDSIISIANAELARLEGERMNPEIDKLDARPGKGIVKVIYAQHYHSFQIDAASGEVLSVEVRNSDLVEHLHDGTWVDNALGNPNGIFKLVYTTIMGTALMLFVFSGFVLWYGPKAMRRQKQLA